MGHHRPASETPFKWRFAGGPMNAQPLMLALYLCFFQGIRTSIANKPYIFVIFQRGSGPPVPPLWIRPCLVKNIDCFIYYIIKTN